VAKTKLQRMKSCRPSPGHLEINQWIREQEARLGIEPSENGKLKPQPTATQVTIIVPLHVAPLARLHALADARSLERSKDADERLDAELREILEGYETDSLPLPRSKHSPQRGKSPRILVND
jgi:hypothetical protein